MWAQAFDTGSGKSERHRSSRCFSCPSVFDHSTASFKRASLGTRSADHQVRLTAEVIDDDVVGGVLEAPVSSLCLLKKNRLH